MPAETNVLRCAACREVVLTWEGDDLVATAAGPVHPTCFGAVAARKETV